MQTTLNFLAKNGIEFTMRHTHTLHHGVKHPGMIFIFTRRREPCLVPDAQVSYIWHFGDREPDVMQGISSFANDMNTMQGIDRFADWEHDFPTRKQARNAYRENQQKLKDTLRVFGEKFRAFCFAVESDLAYDEFAPLPDQPLHPALALRHLPLEAFDEY